MKTKYPSYCCQKCGELIGWIGRIFPFHKCKEKNMNPLPRYNEKGELDTRLRVDPVTGDVGIGTPKEKKYMTKDEALQIALGALTDFDYDKRMSAIETIKEALETKDEPMAWEKFHEHMGGIEMTKDKALEIALEALELHGKQYPYMVKGYCLDAITAIKEALETEEGLLDRKSYLLGLYDQKPWVGLTDEDMNNALDYWSDDSRSAYGGAHSANGEYVDMIETWRYIEAKLKERNI
jgi:hypothetical protein